MTRRPSVLRVALTGGIATGKTYVRGRMAAAGLPTLDADSVVHAMFEPGQPVGRAVVERFGPGVAAAGGGVDRAALGRLVFGDAAARAALEAIVHPAVYARIAAWFDAQTASRAVLAVADIPLLYETGHEGDFDRVVVAACDRARQLARLMARDGWTEAAARSRIEAQWPIERKVERADFVIRTDGRFEDTDRQVDEVLAALRALAPGP